MPVHAEWERPPVRQPRWRERSYGPTGPLRPWYQISEVTRALSRLLRTMEQELQEDDDCIISQLLRRRPRLGWTAETIALPLLLMKSRQGQKRPTCPRVATAKTSFRQVEQAVPAHSQEARDTDSRAPNSFMAGITLAEQCLHAVFSWDERKARRCCRTEAKKGKPC